MPAFATETPAGASVLTTGIGSLPFADLELALDHVFSRYTLPFLPQLPQLLAAAEERARSLMPPMLREILTPSMQKALMQRDAPLLERALHEACEADLAKEQWLRQPATSAFLTRLAGKAVGKVQLIGPLSAELLITHHLKSAPASLGKLIWRWVLKLSHALLELAATHSAAAMTLLWDDGPLVLHKDAATRRSYAESAHELLTAGARFGLHSCAPCDFVALTQLLPRCMLALDLNVVDVFTNRAWDALCAHLGDGGSFIFGIFDTAASALDREKGGKLASQLAHSLKASMGPAAIWSSLVALSGGCGTALHSEDFEKQLSDALEQASTLMTAP